MISYAVCYGEFMYQAGSWKYPRRVVCKAEKSTGQLIHRYTFIVTNMDCAPEELIRIYCKFTTFKLCSSCPYKDEFYETLENIRRLELQLE